MLAKRKWQIWMHAWDIYPWDIAFVIYYAKNKFKPCKTIVLWIVPDFELEIGALEYFTRINSSVWGWVLIFLGNWRQSRRQKQTPSTSVIAKKEKSNEKDQNQIEENKDRSVISSDFETLGCIHFGMKKVCVLGSLTFQWEVLRRLNSLEYLQVNYSNKNSLSKRLHKICTI